MCGSCDHDTPILLDLTTPDGEPDLTVRWMALEDMRQSGGPG